MLILACARTPEDAPVAPTSPPPAAIPVANAPPPAPSATAPVADAEAPPPSEEECARAFDDESAETSDTAPPWAAVSLFQREPSDDLIKLCEALEKRARPRDPESFQCYTRAGGAPQGVWSFVEEHPNPTRPEHYWRLAYAAPGAKIVVATAKRVFGNVDVPAVEGGELPARAELRAITDFDRDGAPEVVVRSGRPLDSSGTPEWTYEVWTLKGAGIVPYAPAAKLKTVWLEDVDSDGIPELVVDPHDIQLGNSMYWSGAKRDWSLVAHAKPDGTFSLDDDVAKKYARSLCPARPSLRKALAGGPLCFAGVAHCARLWSVDSSEIIAAFEAACREAGSENQLCELNQNAWAKVASAKPPLALR